MALPPEPLSDVLPSATTIVVAEVVRVDDDGAWPPGDKGGPIDGAPPRPAQRARLHVTRTLRGGPVDEVLKPAANYALRVGTRGAFLLDDEARILGRYGPDTWSVDEVDAALRGPT
jgi:hypothetical protein